MKRLLLPLFLLLVALSATAQPAERFLLTGQQPSGARVRIYKEGNARTAFFSTIDGLAVVHADDGAYYYASLGAHGLEASSMLAHDPAQRSAEEALFAKDNALTTPQAYAGITAHRAPNRAAARTTSGLGEYGKPANGIVSSIGSITIPVIMVEFPDRAFMDTVDVEKVTRYLNEPGYHDERYTDGSVRDYFLAQSDSLFQPTFSVVARVTVSQNYAYYGRNNGSQRDTNVSVLLREAINAAVAQGADFTPCIVNGRVPLVSLFLAGPGEHNSFEDGYEDYIWAAYRSYSYTASNGVKFASFFVGDEMRQTYQRVNEGTDEDPEYKYVVTGQMLDGMGVFCHEFSHALGLPDFYSTSTGNGVIDFWSLMDYGQYFRNGYRPVGYNAYERSFMGWLRVNDLGDEEQLVTIAPLGSQKGKDSQCYRLVNPANEKEYYLLENRQAGTWYPEQLGHGLLITHVDYLATAWSANTPNNASAHPRFQVFPADGANQVYSNVRSYAPFASDPFPGTGGVTEIASFPLYTGGTLERPFYDIAEEADGTVTFKYLSPTVGIANVQTTAAAHATEVYTLDGRPVAAGKRNLPAGIYIVKSGNTTKKLIIR
ncbi:MAG: M6 family metalloprotease domain-containing protein [Bacteroidaceae bacterium]|nr:M6 family metalloprotease domain-containing protein [Bacteroidaceae bacterium]